MEMGQNIKELLVIIPAKNEEESIGDVLSSIEKLRVREFADVVVIDDNSTDRTAALVKNKGFELIEKKGQSGYGYSLKVGYDFAAKKGYKYVIQMDADGQHDVCNIEHIYSALKGENNGVEPCDIVLGSRFMEGSISYNISAQKRAALGFFRRLIRMGTGVTVLDPTTGLQGLSKRAFGFYAADSGFDGRYPDANMIIRMLLLGFKIKEIPAVMHERKNGTGMHVGIRPVFYMIYMVFSIFKVLIRHRGGTEKYAIIFSEKQMEL